MKEGKRMENKAWKLYDCNAMLGSTIEAQGVSFADAQAMLRHMDRFGIDDSLVYGSLAKYYHAASGNERLIEMIRGVDRLRPVFVAMPGDTGEFWDMKTLREKICAHRAAGIRLCPMLLSDGMRLESFSLKPWCVGEIMELADEMRLPVFLDMEVTHWSDPLPWDDIDRLCGLYPNAPVILVRLGCGDHRDLFPVMRNHGNLYFEISYYAAHLGLEGVASRFGAEQMLFGTDAPVHAPACPIGQLYYSMLTEEQKAAIAGGNLRRLIGGIRYDG